ncbi:PP2C family protein-serine/threonine phosphatase [Pantoea sp. JKS000250]|uniref:PP2C family protein-serine/threonine phosphatase n=1 Tax=Pantoea sp. JKS000250 TaxID=1938795 RepID=UPI000D76020D|nr:PP2C family serine/threonine-protein phosphatase [Pantoea sp. JKS000250]PXW18622.1 protein phosphatase [Pantoea sp. JKS000250]
MKNATLISAAYYSLPKENGSQNQDSILPPLKLSKGWLFAIADGLGGYEGGHLASNSVIEYLSENFAEEFEHGLSNLFPNLKENVKKLSEVDKALVNAASTLTLCHIGSEEVTIAHIGDCRLYIKKNNKLEQITKDHTQHQSYIDKGIFTARELKNAKGKNMLTTAISRTLDLEYNITKIKISELCGNADSFILYLMSDGSHGFWEKRPRFSNNTLSEPSRFTSSLKKRIENGPPVDDYSLISVKFNLSR